MTQMGHTLSGVACGVLCLPARASRARVAIQLATFALLANVPDIEVRGWGHQRYDVSHSLFVNGALIVGVVLLLVALARLRGLSVEWHVLLMGGLAWLSHLLLDSFYNHGRGVGIFWPLSDAHLILPLLWFEVIEVIPPPITVQLLRELSVEFLFYAPFVLLAVMWRRRRFVWARR